MKLLLKPKLKIVAKPKIVGDPSKAFDQINSEVSTVLSVDIGIKNLAYCLMNYNSTDNQFKIYQWGIIDLITKEEEFKCVGKIKSGKNRGKECGKRATFFKSGDKSQSYCGTHKSPGLIPIKMILLCNDKLKSGNNAGKKCNKKANYYHELPSGERIGYCTVHSKNKHDLDLQRFFTVDNISKVELKYKLFRALDQRPELMAETVLVETQPKHATEKMKGLAVAVFDYYVLRGMVDQDKVKDVRSIDAKNKLTVYDGPPLSCPLKIQYDRNKWYGKKYCEWLLRDKPHLLAFYKNFPKKDDLADSLLQGAWYLKFGSKGKRGDVSSAHQKLVYAEQNTAKYKKTRTVKPTAKTMKKGRFTLSNIKYLVKGKTVEQYKKIKGLEDSIKFYFGEVEKFTDMTK